MNKEEIDTITDLLFGNGYDTLKTIIDLSNKLKEKDKEIDRLNEIIKEARKRLEYYNSGEALCYVPIPEILEILDKVKK